MNDETDITLDSVRSTSNQDRDLPLDLKDAQSLRDSVEIAMTNYFNHLDGHHVTDVYDMVLSEVEAPLLEVVMRYTRNNQTRAAEVLGLNRGTLRKKLKQYNMS